MLRVENETKIASAALIAAKAFDRLVTAIEKLIEREARNGKL